MLESLARARRWDLVIVDKAHKMAAYRRGKKLKRPRRYRLGEFLTDHTEYLLLLAAMPHKRDPENFILLLQLLDPDLFANTEVLARAVQRQENPVGADIPTRRCPIFWRRLKEDMKDFDGRDLFPPPAPRRNPGSGRGPQRPESRAITLRDPEGRRVVDEIPKGYEISESVNGIVSLIKKRPAQILPEEVAAVEAAVEQHPKSHNYRVNVKHDRIEIYESVGPDMDGLISDLRGMGIPLFDREKDLREILERGAQFTPILRFTLRVADADTRSFGVQR